MKFLIWVPVILISFVLEKSNSWGCLHFPASYKSTLTEGKKEALIFHDGKNAHLVIRTQITAKKMPAEIAWVLPFPSLPVKYGEVDAKVFEELFRLAPKTQAMNGMDSIDTLHVGQKRGLIVHPATLLEHYQIQPIEIVSDSSENEFNQWLILNGFNPMPLENQKYYLKKGAVFLAIQMKTSGLETIAVRPLHIVYPANSISFPMKFSHDSRIFDLDLYVFSEVNMENKTKNMSKLLPSFSSAYLKLSGSGSYKKDAANPILSQILGDKPGFISLFSAHGLNQGKNRINLVKNDPSLSLDYLGIKK